MKKFAAIIATTVTLSACFGAPPNEKILTDFCTDLFAGEEQTATRIAETTGGSLETYCGCFASQTVSEARNIDLYKDILLSMTELRDAEKLTLDETAEEIERRLDAGEIEGFAEDDLGSLDDAFRDLLTDMMGSNGTCP